jgi:hypothetical protein
MADKLPYLAFFVDDWMSDERLRLCSLAARGLWADMLCVMHKSEVRGYLQRADGLPLTNDQVARVVGCSPIEAATYSKELIEAGVCSLSDTMVIYSRRMVRDENLRAIRSKAGKKGAKVTNNLPRQNPGKQVGKSSANGSANTPANLGLEYVMSIEHLDDEGSGEEGKKQLPPRLTCPDPKDFDRFWEIYPHKLNQHGARIAWNVLAMELDFDGPKLIAILKSQLDAGMLSKSPGSNPLHARTWISERRWTDEIPTGNGLSPSAALEADLARDAAGRAAYDARMAEYAKNPPTTRLVPQRPIALREESK